MTESELKQNDQLDRELRELTEKLKSENSALQKMLDLLSGLPNKHPMKP